MDNTILTNDMTSSATMSTSTVNSNTESSADIPHLANQKGEVSISIKNLYKVFGEDAETAVSLVKNGMSKDELQKEHGQVLGLKNINIEIAAGKIQVIMGLSGSGKSTLIRHINRLIEPTVGEVEIDGVDVLKLKPRELQAFRREYTAMVFQKFALFPHYTIRENIAFGLSVRGISKKQRKSHAQYWLERVGLSGYEKSYPNQLSGGMQQRVGLARALTNDAPILLMDEAFSALDPLIRTDMQSMLLDLQQEISKTIVFITHDLEEALSLGDNIAILRDGEVIQKGSGQRIILHPADEYISNFTKDVNRGRVIRCKLLLEEAVSRDDIPTVNPEMMIEEVIRDLSTADKEVAHVVNKKGKVLGSVTLSAMLSAMLPPNIGDEE